MTVTGIFLDASGNPRVRIGIKFLVETNPAPDAAGVLTAKILVTTTGDAGEMSIVLKQGIYLVIVGQGNARDKFRIIVDASNATVNITDLMTAEQFPAPGITSIGINFRVKNGYLEFLNRDSNTWNPIWIAGSEGAQQLDIQPPGEP